MRPRGGGAAIFAQVYISEADPTRGITSVLDRVQSGTEIVIDRDLASYIDAFVNRHRQPLHPPEWD